MCVQKSIFRTQKTGLAQGHITMEEMTKWRDLRQSEMDLCWKKLTEGMEEEVLDKYKVEESKRGALKGRGDPLVWRKVRKNERYKIRKCGEDCWARFFLVLRIQLGAFAKQAGGVGERRRRERMKPVKNLTKKIRSKGRTDARNRWWVSELLAEDCEKAWTHTGWEDTMQKCY